MQGLSANQRPRKCKTCKQRFTPRNSMQVVCSLKCAAEHGRRDLMSQRRKEKREGRTRLMTRSDWVKKAGKAFNAYIRLRDAAMPCISCGRGNDEVQGIEGWKPGGAWDCGHFLAVGSHPHLRFETDNAHKQCKSCNGGSGNYAAKAWAVAAGYRANLIARIGIERVEAVEADQEPRKYTIPELMEIERTYKTKLKELKHREAA